MLAVRLKRGQKRSPRCVKTAPAVPSISGPHFPRQGHESKASEDSGACQRESPLKPRCGKRNAAPASRPSLLLPLSCSGVIDLSRLLYLSLLPSLLFFPRFSPSFAVAAGESRQSAKISKGVGWCVCVWGVPQGESWIKRGEETEKRPAAERKRGQQ